MTYQKYVNSRQTAAACEKCAPTGDTRKRLLSTVKNGNHTRKGKLVSNHTQFNAGVAQRISSHIV